MVLKAYQNKNQKEGDTSRLWNTDYVLKAFDSRQNLLKTLPRNLLKILHLFIERHEFFPASLDPSHYANSNRSFVMDNAVFHGPFGDGEFLNVE